MPISEFHIEQYLEYFSGSKHNYGEHVYDKEPQDGGKRTGRSSTIKDKLITIEDYRDHLLGNKGLGVIPIDENSKCKFAVIDIDIYDIDYTLYIQAIERNKFPLVPFASKSGGLHVYAFFKEPIPASKATECMRKLAFYLSIDKLVKAQKNTTVEVFPKQTKLSKGDVGSWINLPYFNAEKTATPAIREGKGLNLNEALQLIKERITTLQEVDDFIENLEYGDAPPCLQLLSILNPVDAGGGRNNYLFSFGVYLKKKDEDFFEQNLKEINQSLRAPIKESELERTVISSLKRKDYLYRCKESPCVDFCNKKECKNREYGIGKNEGYFSSVEVGQLYQYRTAQPYYEWEVKLQEQESFKKLRFKSEDEIIRQDAFLRLCMRELHELPSKLKQAEWFNKVNQALKEIQTIQVDEEDDTSPYMMLRMHINEFLTGRAMAETRDQIMIGRVFYNRASKEYFFRTKDLVKYIYETKQFRHFSPTELHGLLRELKCSNKTARAESGRQIRIAAVGQEVVNSQVIYEEFNPDFSKFKEDF